MSSPFKCMVAGCDYRSRPDVKFHGFPKDAARCRVWTDFCKIPPFDSHPLHQAVCDRHFREEDYMLSFRVLNRPKKVWKLNRDANPSLFPPTTSEVFVPEHWEVQDPVVELEMDIEDDLIVEEEVVDVKQEDPEPPLESRCRLCWNVPFNAENVFSLFDENDGQESLQSDLMTFFQLQFEDTPEYPSRVCGSCVDFMMDIKAFKNQIMASHSLFSKEIERVKEEAHDESYTDTTEHIQEDVEEDEVEEEEEEEDDEKEKKPTFKLCKYCEKRYPTTKALKIHYKATHKGIPLDCPTCGKVFKVLANFKKHKLIHLPKSERPHKCPHCESRFVGAGQLNIHIQRLHDVKERYMCEDCGRGFSTNSNLYDHRQNIHSGRRDPETGKVLREKESKVAQPCPVCGEKFVNLSSHMVRMHKEGKPNDWSLFDPNEEVTCPVESCARVLSRLDMREHSKEHFVGKYCEYCFIRIKSPGLANRHINKHRGILFPCEHCDKVYDNDQGLYLHMRSRHTDVYEQTIKRQKR